LNRCLPLPAAPYPFAVAVSLSVLSMAAGVEPATAQPAPFPAKPVRIVVPFAPGGPNDLIVRLVGPRLGELWAQPVIVENRPGAGATTGMEVVAKSAPDGYTLGVGNNSSLVIGPLMQPKVGYDPVKDLVPMGSMALTAYVLAVNPRVPAKRVSELIAIAKAKPGFLAYASSGAATIGRDQGRRLNPAVRCGTPRRRATPAGCPTS